VPQLPAMLAGSTRGKELPLPVPRAAGSIGYGDAAVKSSGAAGRVTGAMVTARLA